MQNKNRFEDGTLKGLILHIQLIMTYSVRKKTNGLQHRKAGSLNPYQQMFALRNCYERKK